jgi:hypothetical protein
MNTPQVGTMNDRKDDSQMEAADGAAVATPPKEGRTEAFTTGMGKGEY